jgi:bisphosphoglycerate-independent phosphoglycerate mutase (AlkP superfamily)
LTPDLIVGYYRGYRASWATCLGGMTDAILLDNTSAWSADHCADASEVPGILFCNRSIAAQNVCLQDLAPTILAAFAVNSPDSITGKNIFRT